MVQHIQNVLLLHFAASAIATYDENLAMQYAKLAGAAYCPPETLQTWSCGSKCKPFDVKHVKICHGTATYSYVGIWNSSRCLVSFEGSWDPRSWLQNLDVKEIASPWPKCGEGNDTCHVHAGFVEEWFSHQGCVINALESIGCGRGAGLYTTGHSLGAAVNAFAMVSLQERGWNIVESYDFGRPRIGDHAFASYFDDQFRGRSWRVVQHRDPVPHAPVTDPANLWEFQHTAPEVFYKTSDVKDGYNVCQQPENNTRCSFQFEGPQYPWNIFYWHDHVTYMDDVPMYGTLPSWARLVLQLPSSGCNDTSDSYTPATADAVLV